MTIGTGGTFGAKLLAGESQSEGEPVLDIAVGNGLFFWQEGDIYGKAG